jgi:hypothetical protein
MPGRCMFENVPSHDSEFVLIGIAKSVPSLHFRTDRLSSLVLVAFPIIPSLIPWQAHRR